MYGLIMRAIAHTYAATSTAELPLAAPALMVFCRDARELMLVTGPPFWALFTLLALMAC
jgi:hypothetical protein